MKRKVEPLEVPRFSLAEREQRWKRVRQLMEHDGLDVLIVPSSNRLAGHASYLSGMGGNHAPVAVVFPRTGEVTALTGPVPSHDYWLRFQDWVTDIRAHFFSEGEALIERLRELALERGRIGLVGLADLPRLPDGVIPHELYLKLRHAFPNAELINATFLLDEARFVKSSEEIAFLQRSIELVEGAILWTYVIHTFRAKMGSWLRISQMRQKCFITHQVSGFSQTSLIKSSSWCDR